MNLDCNILNPLQRTGLSQRRRLIRALHPSYVLVDERDISDLLLYAKEYASQLKYYSQENTVSDNWQRFIEADISTLVAVIAKFDTKSCQDEFVEASREGVIESLEPILKLLRQVYGWKQGAIKGFALYASLERSISATIRSATITTIAYQKKIEITSQNGGFTFNSALFNFADDITPANIPADSTFYLSGDYTDEDDKDYAERKIKQLFDKVYETVISLVQQAPKFLEETFTNFPQHEPHFALFLAFLQLYRIAQNHLNKFTKHHLDFYYQEVLQIAKRPEQADEVHLILQLAKNFNNHLIEKDTAFKAGKDENGTNVTFATDKAIVINRIQRYVNGLKNIFVDKDENNIVNNIYAAPVANSADGQSEEFTTNQKWQTFGSVEMPYAEVGFAIASPIFLLQEGKRVITLTFHFDIVDKNKLIDYSNNKENIEKELASNIKATFSGEKDWVACNIASVKLCGNLNTKLTIEFTINLPPELPAFVAYNNQVLKSGIKTDFPVLRLYFDNDGLEYESFNQITNSKIPFKDARKNLTLPNRIKFDKSSIVNIGNNFFFAPNEIVNIKPNIKSTSWKVIGKSYPYKYFQFLNITKLDLKVEVTGMKNLILENDQGIINPTKPFLPFGPIPKVGGKFYIGSNEVFQKSLNMLDLTLNWIDVPKMSFGDHYSGYINSNITNDNQFTVNVEILNSNRWTEINCKNINCKNIFDENPKGDSSKNLVPPKHTNPFAIKNENKFLIYKNINLANENFEQYSINMERGFIRLVLNQDFLHSKYAPSIANFVKNGGTVPNEPYTPTLSEFTLAYTSEESITFSNTRYDGSIEQFFHLHPFGGVVAFYPNETELPQEKVTFSKKLIPEFTFNNDATTPPIPAEGTFYIGLTDVEAPQNVSILFQVAEGSADPDVETPSVEWSYLSYNRWYQFENTQIISDSTDGLLNSGIITFALPKDINAENTILPNGVFWIKATVVDRTVAISKMIAVLPQAVRASFRKNATNDLKRLADPLPNESISKLKERRAAVKKVLQPFASFNGRLEEQNESPTALADKEERFLSKYNEYYIRVSERLKHKNRAVTIDDYERIILQQFPDIYIAKCLNHNRISKESLEQIASEHAPGFVKIIVLPNLRNQNAIDPLRPKVSSGKLKEIEQFLTSLKNDFIQLEVRNPIFEEVAVAFSVQLRKGFDEGFYLKKLKEDIVKFLSPWLYEQGADLEIGGRIHRSEILNFVEETEYVDYLTDFQLNHYIPKENGEFEIREHVEEAVVTTSSSVLIPRAAAEQRIKLLNSKTV